MRGERIKARVLATRIIPNADGTLLAKLGLPPELRSLGLLTADSDDVAYTALDEATKMADVRVAYAQSLYAGAANASMALAGEFIGVLAGPTPDEVRSGLAAAVRTAEEEASFVSANEANSILYYAHCISRTGSYLSGVAGIAPGQPLAYLIAPPLEALWGLDAALKAAQVELKLFYGPPTNTNFAGGLLTGEQSACRAACEAFAEAVCEIADGPRCV